jgi:hypothetical protein
MMIKRINFDKNHKDLGLMQQHRKFQASVSNPFGLITHSDTCLTKTETGGAIARMEQHSDTCLTKVWI